MESIGRSENSLQRESLLAKTAAAAEELKRLLYAEKQWAEERAEWQRKFYEQEQAMLRQSAKIKGLEDARSADSSAWRKEKSALMQELEGAHNQILELRRASEAKTQQEVPPPKPP